MPLRRSLAHTIALVSKADAPSVHTGAANLNPQQTIRLAVIDDDSGFVTVLAKRTEAAGWQLRQVASAIPPEELVAMKLNALLLDPAVLGEDGWGYLERVCGMLPDLGVVVCTGRSTVAQRVRGLRLGVDDWITKPCHPEEAMARIEAVSRRRRRGRSERRGGPAGRRRAGDPRRPVPGLRQRRQPRPDPPRVRAAAAARRGQGPGAGAGDDLPAGVGIRDGPRRPLGRRLHPQAAPEAGEALAGLELHPHPLRGRLPVRPRARSARTRRRGPVSPVVRRPEPTSPPPEPVFTTRSQQLHAG